MPRFCGYFSIQVLNGETLNDDSKTTARAFNHELKMKPLVLFHNRTQQPATLLGAVLLLSLLPGMSYVRAQQISCGQTIGGSISSAGQTNSYTFDANA